jgi:hypothetical protein
VISWGGGAFAPPPACMLKKALSYTEPPRLRYLLQVVKTQTMAAYCTMLPTLDSTFEKSSGSSDTKHDSRAYCRLIRALYPHLVDRSL